MAEDPQLKRVLEICDGALEVSEAERNAYLNRACGGDAALRSSVDSVLLAINDATEMLGSADPERSVPIGSDPEDGAQIGPYTIQEKIGEGGMGAVYKAERRGDGFTQRVALKLVRSHLTSRDLMERFNAERRILAGLHHPYIARLVDGGTTDQGVPYLAMEFVEGVPIDRYCDENRLDLHQRIELLRKVAVAVQSAHQNLVVHRDLKPSNVLVTADGIPKLLDFGIAKLIETEQGEDEAGVTQFGSRALTPDYASPEQILDGKVTVASDVYSLGVLTYQLLAGDLPYRIERSSYRAMVESVDKLTVPRASTRFRSNTEEGRDREIASRRSTTPARMVRALTGDLDTILMKALHKEPDRRYPSVEAFSADLDRYSRGMPVEARDDSWSYRASRFVRRNRLAVAAGSVALLLLLGALASTTWSFIQADRARVEADQRFEQVRSIARTMMFEVYDEVEKVPGTRAAKQTLAETAQEYLEALSNSPGAGPDVVYEAAQGFSRLSSILERQSVDSNETRETAEAAADRAVELLNGLVDTHPAPGRVLRTLGELHSNHGIDMLYSDNQPEPAREELERGLDAYRRAEKLRPDRGDWIVDRLLVERRIADTWKWQGDYERTEKQLEGLIKTLEQLESRLSENPDFLKLKADARIALGESLYFQSRYDETVQPYIDGLALYREHLDTHGANARIDGARVIALWYLGNTYNALDQPESALPPLDEALALIDEVLAGDPEDLSAMRRKLVVESSKADSLAYLGRHDEGIALLESGVSWFEERERADDVSGNHRSTAIQYEMLGSALDYAGRTPEACRWWRKALDKWLMVDERFGLAEFDTDQPNLMRTHLETCN